MEYNNQTHCKTSNPFFKVNLDISVIPNNKNNTFY